MPGNMDILKYKHKSGYQKRMEKSQREKTQPKIISITKTDSDTVVNEAVSSSEIDDCEKS